MAPALEYIAAKVKTSPANGKPGHPLNRGDIMLLVVLIDQHLPVASDDWTDPLNRKRLTAIREKLGDFAITAPQMSKAEAKQFRE